MITALKWLLWLSIVIILLQILLFLYLILSKAWSIHIEKRKEKRKDYYGPYVMKYLTEGDDSRVLHHLLKLDSVVLVEMLQEYSRLLSAKDVQQRISSYASSFMTETFRKKMNAVRRTTRLNTLYAIESFQMKSLSGEVKNRLQKKLEDEERSQLLRILAVFHDHELDQYLVDSNKKPLPDYLYREIFYNMEEHAFTDYTERIDSLPTEARCCLIDIIGDKRDYRYLEIVERMLESTYKEERIRAMKAIGRIGFLKNKHVLAHKARSNEWEERLMAAKAMEIIRSEDFLPVLQHLLYDTSWWVQRAAARTIAEYPGGYNLLKEIHQNEKNPSVRDVIIERLEVNK